MQDSIKTIDTIVYAGKMKDRDALMESSSGGAFTALSDVFLDNGDGVACCTYNYASHVSEFVLATTKEERDTARGSKYMQSIPGDIYTKCAEWLKENPNKNLLFVGVGCQSEGFRKYAELMGIREQVYIVNLVCHGSPSPKIWREYAAELETANGGKMKYLTFRDKRKGWESPTAFCIVNGNEVLLNKYTHIFYNQCALRPSCHVCPFATTERKVDLTIGDFWHIEEKMPDFYDPDGISLFLIHTERGLELFNAIKKSLDYRRSNVKDCWQMNLEMPTPASPLRSVFWRDYKKKGVNYIMKKYGSVSLAARVRNKIMRIYGGGVFELNNNYYPVYMHIHEVHVAFSARRAS